MRDETVAALVGISIPVAIVGAVFWLMSENDEDIARKPELVETVLAQSLAACDLQSDLSQKAPYEERLREVFESTYSVTLDYLINEGITVCLDQRIADARDASGTWDQRADAFYYPDEKILTLYDNGNSYANSGTFEQTAGDYGDDLLDSFRRGYRGILQNYPDLQLGYNHSKGTAWVDGGSDYAIAQKNPELLEPPIISFD